MLPTTDMPPTDRLSISSKDTLKYENELISSKKQMTAVTLPATDSGVAKTYGVVAVPTATTLETEITESNELTFIHAFTGIPEKPAFGGILTTEEESDGISTKKTSEKEATSNLRDYSAIDNASAELSTKSRETSTAHVTEGHNAITLGEKKMFSSHYTQEDTKTLVKGENTPEISTSTVNTNDNTLSMTTNIVQKSENALSPSNISLSTPRTSMYGNVLKSNEPVLSSMAGEVTANRALQGTSRRTEMKELTSSKTFEDIHSSETVYVGIISTDIEGRVIEGTPVMKTRSTTSLETLSTTNLETLTPSKIFGTVSHRRESKSAGPYEQHDLSAGQATNDALTFKIGFKESGTSSSMAEMLLSESDLRTSDVEKITNSGDLIPTQTKTTEDVVVVSSSTAVKYMTIPVSYIEQRKTSVTNHMVPTADMSSSDRSSTSDKETLKYENDLTSSKKQMATDTFSLTDGGVANTCSSVAIPTSAEPFETEITESNELTSIPAFTGILKKPSFGGILTTNEGFQGTNTEKTQEREAISNLRDYSAIDNASADLSTQLREFTTANVTEGHNAITFREKKMSSSYHMQEDTKTFVTRDITPETSTSTVNTNDNTLSMTTNIVQMSEEVISPNRKAILTTGTSMYASVLRSNVPVLSSTAEELPTNRGTKVAVHGTSLRTEMKELKSSQTFENIYSSETAYVGITSTNSEGGVIGNTPVMKTRRSTTSLETLSTTNLETLTPSKIFGTVSHRRESKSAGPYEQHNLSTFQATNDARTSKISFQESETSSSVTEMLLSESDLRTSDAEQITNSGDLIPTKPQTTEDVAVVSSPTAVKFVTIPVSDTRQRNTSVTNHMVPTVDMSSTDRSSTSDKETLKYENDLTSSKKQMTAVTLSSTHVGFANTHSSVAVPTAKPFETEITESNESTFIPAFTGISEKPTFGVSLTTKEEFQSTSTEKTPERGKTSNLRDYSFGTGSHHAITLGENKMSSLYFEDTKSLLTRDNIPDISTSSMNINRNVLSMTNDIVLTSEVVLSPSHITISAPGTSKQAYVLKSTKGVSSSTAIKAPATQATKLTFPGTSPTSEMKEFRDSKTFEDIYSSETTSDGITSTGSLIEDTSIENTPFMKTRRSTTSLEILSTINLKTLTSEKTFDTESHYAITLGENKLSSLYYMQEDTKSLLTSDNNPDVRKSKMSTNGNVLLMTNIVQASEVVLSPSHITLSTPGTSMQASVLKSTKGVSFIINSNRNSCNSAKKADFSWNISENKDERVKIFPDF
ncbi:serine-rich adhesin for platelets-like [Ptychodera flava]|uniref:serine-rich adhesin for platelets-like n=1 Tax=Ptychodera flava TaxID=63121 RepID=UPI00396AA035